MFINWFKIKLSLSSLSLSLSYISPTNASLLSNERSKLNKDDVDNDHRHGVTLVYQLGLLM